MLAMSVHGALSHALQSLNTSYPDLQAPATPEELLRAITALKSEALA